MSEGRPGPAVPTGRGRGGRAAPVRPRARRGRRRPRRSAAHRTDARTGGRDAGPDAPSRSRAAGPDEPAPATGHEPPQDAGTEPEAARALRHRAPPAAATRWPRR